VTVGQRQRSIERMVATSVTANRSASRLAEIAKILGIAVVYTATARLGLLLDPVGGFATLVWAPTGIAIAAVMILGASVWPGVFLGALVANRLTGAPMLVAATIAVGNTLECLVALVLLRRVRGFRDSLERVSDVLYYMLLATVFAPLVSATIGVSALRVAQIVTEAQTGEAWRAWWVGDFMGALLIGPLVLLWRANALRGLRRAQSLELVALAITLIGLALLVFFERTPLERNSFLQAYLLFPVLIWAALRFDQRGVVTAVLMMALIAIAATSRARGPFVHAQLHESLFALQTFMGIIAASFLVLATAIGERARAQTELRRALEAEAKANRAKSDFLAVMSHEFRTPLNAISGFAQLLSMDVHGSLTPKQRDALARIEQNQDRLASLVSDVLSFTGVESGRLSLKLERISIRAALDALKASVEPELTRKRLHYARSPSLDSLAVKADPDKLRQVLLNVVSNAIKYTDEGGVVDVSATGDEGQVRVVVRDTGIGIPEDQLQRVFEPFFQVDRGKTRRFGGVGLGLTIARDLARAMGGDVTIESTPGRGTTVSLSFPAA